MAIILKKFKGRPIQRDDSTADWGKLFNLMKLMVVLFLLFSGFHWYIIKKVQAIYDNSNVTKMASQSRPLAHAKIYTVRSGDTLWSIASGQYPHEDAAQKVKEIEKINQLNGKSIRVGQPLKMP